MLALLKKDWFTLTKQLKIFLLIVVVFACLPGYSVSSFAIIYAALLPLTALAYDERSQWDTLAAMLPYSPTSLVASKYVLGYLGIIGAEIISVVAYVLLNYFRGSVLEAEYFITSGLVINAALLILACSLPFMFKLGVEKGRLVFFLILMLVIIGGMFWGDQTSLDWAEIEIQSVGLILGGSLVFALLANLVSILISVGIYKRKF